MYATSSSDGYECRIQSVDNGTCINKEEVTIMFLKNIMKHDLLNYAASVKI